MEHLTSRLMHRCCNGIEAPELADQLCKQGWYSPLPSHDMWSFGLLLLLLLAVQRPEAHLNALRGGSPATLSYARSLLRRAPHKAYASQVMTVLLSLAVILV